jgi:hypothetical protein
MISEISRIAELSDDERRLLTSVYASLTNHIMDEIEYHLADTYPDMQIERDRQWDLRDLVAHRLDALGREAL